MEKQDIKIFVIHKEFPIYRAVDILYENPIYYNHLEYIEDLELYTYITFADEENYRVEISNLTDSQKEHIVGASPVSSGVGIVFYKTIGIKNFHHMKFQFYL